MTLHSNEYSPVQDNVNAKKRNTVKQLQKMAEITQCETGQARGDNPNTCTRDPPKMAAHCYSVAVVVARLSELPSALPGRR